MLAYHGTSLAALRRILRDGLLRPRENDEGNWEEYPSRSDCVYLSTTYPIFYAMCAGGYSGDSKDIAILEIDVDELDVDLLLPDEDFVAQCLAVQQKLDLHSTHRKVVGELEKYSHHWIDSVNKMGNCCYKGPIPLAHVTQIAVVDVTLQPDITRDCLQPSISPINFALMGSHYQKMVDWLFERRELLPQAEDGRDNYIARFVPRYREFWEERSSNRDGITVFPPDLLKIYIEGDKAWHERTT